MEGLLIADRSGQKLESIRASNGLENSEVCELANEFELGMKTQQATCLSRDQNKVEGEISYFNLTQLLIQLQLRKLIEFYSVEAQKARQKHTWFKHRTNQTA
jgi:hypothetical protein